MKITIRTDTKKIVPIETKVKVSDQKIKLFFRWKNVAMIKLPFDKSRGFSIQHFPLMNYQWLKSIVFVCPLGLDEWPIRMVSACTFSISRSDKNKKSKSKFENNNKVLIVEHALNKHVGTHKFARKTPVTLMKAVFSRMSTKSDFPSAQLRWQCFSLFFFSVIELSVHVSSFVIFILVSVLLLMQSIRLNVIHFTCVSILMTSQHVVNLKITKFDETEAKKRAN